MVRVGGAYVLDAQEAGVVVNGVATIGERIARYEHSAVATVPAEDNAFGERGTDAAELYVIAAMGMMTDGGLFVDANFHFVFLKHYFE